MVSKLESPLLMVRALARIEAGRKPPFDAARLVLHEVDQRPDLLLRQLSAPGGHLPAVALLLDLPVVDDAEDLGVRAADAEEQTFAAAPVGPGSRHAHDVLHLPAAAVALVAEHRPDRDRLDRSLQVPELRGRLLLGDVAVPFPR